MRKFNKAVVAVVLATSLTAMTVNATDIDTLREQKAAAQSEVNSLQAQLDEVVANLSQLENDLIAKGEEIEEAQEDLDAAIELEEAQRAAMALRIKYMYESGKPSLVTAVLESDDVADALNKAEYAAGISSYDRGKVQEYLNTQEEIKTLKAKLETEQAEMESLQAEYEQKQEDLGVMLADAEAEVADLGSQLQAAIAAEQERQRQAAAAAAAAAAGNGGSSSSGSTANTGGGTVNTGGSSGGGSTAAPSIPQSSGKGGTIVAAAYSQIGVPYVWGGTTPGVGLDCSGLTQYCYRMAGISIPRTSGAQLAGGTIVSDPQPGDICWTPGHVGIYIGDGKMIEAQQDGTNVMISDSRADAYVRY